MKNVNRLLFIFILFSCLSCSKGNNKLGPKEFENALKNYYNYLDSSTCIDKMDYIYIKASINNDSTVFLITLWAGSYIFIKDSIKIVDFFTYKGKKILLIGDYPNDIVKIEKNRNLNVIDIVKNQYPEDYRKYLKDPHSVGPLIYDYMNMTLIFKNKKLLSCTKEYY